VLDILMQSHRNKQAAKKFFRKLLKGLQYVPRVIITDKLKSHGAAKREILPGVEHRQSRYLNNWCENSHRPTRQREYRMQGFKSPRHATKARETAHNRLSCAGSRTVCGARTAAPLMHMSCYPDNVTLVGCAGSFTPCS
jgi:putative transposase